MTIPNQPPEIPRLQVTEVEDHLLVLVDDRNSDGMEFRVKWDGCIDFNEVNARTNYFHICDLDQFILLLVAVRNQAKEHFGESWLT